MTSVRNAAAEASEILGGNCVGLVLEPSPPAVDDGDYFADDPINAPIPRGFDQSLTVSSVGKGKSWAAVVEENPELAHWAEARWLTNTRRLADIPADYVERRADLHRLATYVVAPARHQATGKFGLRWTRGGFGTPFFENNRQVRVEGNLLVVQESSYVKSTPITSLTNAAKFIGCEIDDKIAAEGESPIVGDATANLDITADVVEFLDGWWGMATASLEQVRADQESIKPGRVQLWPGHLDCVMVAGDVNRRASFGASPGDASSNEPYLYISIWWPDRLDLSASDGFWNSENFVGARMPFSFLSMQPNPVDTAIDFFRGGRDRLQQSELAYARR